MRGVSFFLLLGLSLSRFCEHRRGITVELLLAGLAAKKVVLALVARRSR